MLEERTSRTRRPAFQGQSIEDDLKTEDVTVLYVEFIGLHRLFDLYGYASGLKMFRRVCEEIVVSSVVEYGGAIVKLLNDAIKASYQDPIEAVKSAIRMKMSIEKRNNATSEGHRVDFAISVSCGEGFVEGSEIRGPVADVLAKMQNMTGRRDQIYVSEHVYVAADKMKGVEYRRVGALRDAFSHDFNVYEVLWREDIDLEPHESIISSQFQHRYAIIEGTRDACFYCGGRRHLSSDCPSKSLPELTPAFNNLRYMSLRKMNELFSRCILIGLDKVWNKWEENNVEGIDDAYFNAYYGFYDIKRVYQLRFFRVIMGYNGNDWYKATKMNAESDGGALWIAQDCLRTGDLLRAETLLQDLYKGNPDSFGTNMLMGYFNIEKGHYIYALDNFKNAFRNAGTNPRKILALLLMCRISFLYFNDMAAAEEQIRLIKRIERDCPEAIYQDIVMKIQRGGDSKTITHLMNLVKRCPEYYLTSMIDPELINSQAEINKELHALCMSEKKDADALLGETERRVRDLTSWFGEAEQNVRNVAMSFLQTKEKYDSHSYFGYYDGIHGFSSIISDCNRLEGESREEIKGLIEGMEREIDRLSEYLKEERFHDELTGKLDILKEETKSFEKEFGLSLSYKDATARHEKLSHGLYVIQEAAGRIDKRRAIVSFMTGLSVKALLFFILLTFTFFVLVPIFDPGAILGVEKISSSNLIDYKGVILALTSMISIGMASAAQYKGHLRRLKKHLNLHK